VTAPASASWTSRSASASARRRRPVPLLPALASLPGVGPARAKELADAGVETALDLLLHLPFRYEDRTRIAPIAALVPEGPAVTVKGEVLSARLIRTRRRGFTIFEAILDDGSGPLRLVFFNQPYLQRWLLPKKVFWAYGIATRAARFRRGLVMENPQIEERIEDLLEGEEGKDPLSVGRVVPIYRKLPALTPRARRRLVSHLLRNFADRLPERLHDIAEREQEFPSLADSLREAHFPGSAGGPADAEPWTERTSPYLHRLVYEEFLEFQVGLQRRRRERAADPAPILAADERIRARLRAVLPFTLTAAQKRVIREIGEDFRRGTPMRRLLQGDVGSGKTIVAVLSAVLAAACGYQTAIMAPTEILAEQHAATVFRLLAKSGLVPALLTGRVKGKARSALLDQLAGGRIDLLVGTHALLENPVKFLRLGLIVIDEQHRFGVVQRTALAAKAGGTGKKPHLLVMSATPIPRSLALTLYGDLDVSTLDEKPPGRTPVATRVLPESERTAAFREIEAEIRNGGQAYVVVPLIEESDKIEARAVEKHAEEIRRALPARKVGVVHGRVPPEERERTMGEFAAGRLDVLAATTVIEVGVDVPNASYMLVENAERFGLAQLHQLRGRVGRGKRASRCVLLFGTAASPESRERLFVLEKTDDGFVVAEEDLKRRGPGDALGTRQSGVPLFRVGDLVRDVAWMRRARDDARRLLAEGADEPFRTPFLLPAADLPAAD
jgi:ATP-dependent DNA helicase RecG